MQQLAGKWRRSGIPVGFVPTMGYLHAGHLSLVDEARKRVGKRGRVIVSIYVNPTQFAPAEDLANYPRNLHRDLQLLRSRKVDAVFTPGDAEMYRREKSMEISAAGFSTYVLEEKLSRLMEGASRPGHFRGVTTVVAKLFNIVLPTVAVFGAKDWQQAAVIRRMVADLNFPVKVIVAPTVRESDGLALSSRNKYLSQELRSKATILWRSIQQVRSAVKKSSRPISAVRLKEQLRQMIDSEARLDYVEFFRPDTLDAVPTVSKGTHMALAVYLGKTRLIDNGLV